MDTALATIETALASLIPALAELNMIGRSAPIVSYIAARLRNVVGAEADRALSHERVKAHRITASAHAALGMPEA